VTTGFFSVDSFREPTEERFSLEARFSREALRSDPNLFSTEVRRSFEEGRSFFLTPLGTRRIS